MSTKYPFDYFDEGEINPVKSSHHTKNNSEQDGQLAFFKPYNTTNNNGNSTSIDEVSNAAAPSVNRHIGNRNNQFIGQAGRLNQRYNNHGHGNNSGSGSRQEHSYSAAEPLNIEDMYIYGAQIDVVSQDLSILAAEMPVKFEQFIFDYAQVEGCDDNIDDFIEYIRELKLLCDRATLREKDLYEILNHIDSQGLRFKSIDIDQLTNLLDSTKNDLAKLPAMNIIQNSPTLISEYEQLEGRVHALNKEILRRTIYDKASATHHLIRPLRSLKSAIYYINRFVSHAEPRQFLHKAVRMLTRLRELANFIVQPQHQLNDVQVQQILEVIKQGSYEWDSEFLANGSSVWEFGPFDIKKIPLVTVAPAHSDNYGGEEEISLSVIPDYLIHQVRILLNNLGLRKKPQTFQNNYRQNRQDNSGNY